MPDSNAQNTSDSISLAQTRDQNRELAQKGQEAQEEIRQLDEELTQAEQIDLAHASQNPQAKLEADVEKDLMLHIILSMRHQKISVGEAERLANDFLSLLPFIDKEDLLRKLNVLSGKYPEAQAVYLKYAAPHEEEKRRALLDAVTEHIRNGNIEQAIAVAKGGKPNGIASS